MKAKANKFYTIFVILSASILIALGLLILSKKNFSNLLVQYILLKKHISPSTLVGDALVSKFLAGWLSILGGMAIIFGILMIIFSSFLASFLSLEFFIFGISFLFGLLIYDKLKIGFYNPWELTSYLGKIKFNPLNNIVRFTFLIFLPSFSLIIYHLINFKNYKSNFTTQCRYYGEFMHIGSRLLRMFLFVLLITVVFFVAGNIYTYHNKAIELDSYNEGETLGMATNYLKGQAPYRDTIFMRGAFQDPLRSVIAFKLFGKSIASSRMLQSILEITALFLFVAALFFLYEKKIFYLSLVVPIMLFLLTNKLTIGFKIMHRDICLFIFLIIAILLYDRVIKGAINKGKLKTHVLLFLYAFIPTLSFAYSVDRGFFLSATATITVWILYFMFLKRNDFKYLFSILIGYAMGVIGLGIAIRWAYYDFFKFIFLIMPRYNELMAGSVYDFRSPRPNIPIILISLSVFWIVNRFLKGINFARGEILKSINLFYKSYFLEILLLLLSILYYRYVFISYFCTERMLLASCPLYLLIIYIIFKHYINLHIAKFLNFKRTKIILFLIALLLPIAFLVFYVPRIDFKSWYKFPLGISDETIIPDNYKKVTNFLKNNLKTDEYFLTLTSEAIWYYLVDRPCLIRFPIIWFAMPNFYQKEVIEDLKNNDVKFIIYEIGHGKIGQGKIGGLSIEEALPMLVDYIKRNFSFCKQIDDVLIYCPNKK